MRNTWLFDHHELPPAILAARQRAGKNLLRDGTTPVFLIGNYLVLFQYFLYEQVNRPGE
jgi:hypothetical protein